MKNINTIVWGGLLWSAAFGASGAHAQEIKANVARPITLTGIVAGAPQGREFFLRANRQIYRISTSPSVAMNTIRGGDRVRVFGIPTRLNLQRANVRVLQRRASDSPGDYETRSGPITNPR